MSGGPGAGVGGGVLERDYGAAFGFSDSGLGVE